MESDGIGPNRIEPDRIGPNWTQSDRTGPNRTEPDRTEAKEQAAAAAKEKQAVGRLRAEVSGEVSRIMNTLG